MRRDTLVVKPNGFFVVRFVADNPGIWLFHCHIEWHFASGLTATMVEDVATLQKIMTIPQQHLDNCKAGNVPTAAMRLATRRTCSTWMDSRRRLPDSREVSCIHALDTLSQQYIKRSGHG